MLTFRVLGTSHYVSPRGGGLNKCLKKAEMPFTLFLLNMYFYEIVIMMQVGWTFVWGEVSIFLFV